MIVNRDSEDAQRPRRAQASGRRRNPPLDRRGFIAACAALGACATGWPGVTRAQSYPVRAIRLVVPFVAGGGPDVVSRHICERMSRALGQPMVVENRPGANGMLGLQSARQAAPDGHTLVYLSSAHAATQVILRNADILRDFAPIGRMTETPSVVAVAPAFPAGSMAQLVEQLRRNPGKFNYGTGGVGSPSHLATGMLHNLAGPFEAVPIHYKGAPEIGHAVMQGEVHFTITIAPPLLPLLRQGRLRALAVTTTQRMKTLPDVPTMAEAGYPDYRFHSWGGIAAPAGTPPAIVARLHAEMAKILSSPETAAFIESVASQAESSASPAEFAAFIRLEFARIEKLVREFGIRPEQGR